jgi:hypothetical protein
MLIVVKATAYAYSVTKIHKSFWNTILKFIFKNSIALTGQGYVAGWRESGNEPCFIKCGE